MQKQNIPPENRKQAPEKQAAIEYLHDAGGHFVLLRGKRPIWKGYRRRTPSVEIITHHAGRGLDLGLFPFSVGTSALDVDTGEIGELIEAEPPLTILGTPRGHHLYYQDDTPRRNGKFNSHGCTGDIRSANGYLRFYEKGPVKLAHALATTAPGAAPFHADLFGVAGVRLPRDRKPAKVFSFTPTPTKWVLEDVQDGQRHYALFDVVRFWSYQERKPLTLDAWCGHVLAFAHSQNARLPDPQTDAEIDTLAHSIATWTWDGGGPLDHSTWSQRRRGIKSGKNRRKRTRERDLEIVREVMAGASMRAVGRSYGLSHFAIRHIVRREQAGKLDFSGRKAVHSRVK